MSQDTIIFFLAAVIAVLSFVVLYQRFIFRKGIQKKIGDMGDTLEQILDEKSDEKVMVFTYDKALIHLSSQINRLLDDRQRIQADFRRSEISAKNMLSNISHDIRTPMTVILGYLEIMRLEAEGKDKMVAKVEQKARKVMELINQFFTLAKLESGDTQVEMGRVNLSECCRENVLDFYELLTQKEFQVEIEIPEEPVFVEGNEEALQRILFNLISNAVRYGSDGKYLGIAVRTEVAFALIHVTERGKGIEKAFAGTVFERLFTMEDSRNREIQGNGLGLTIARNLAVKMGGDITLVSEPDVSTTFTVKLRKMTF